MLLGMSSHVNETPLYLQTNKVKSETWWQDYLFSIGDNKSLKSDVNAEHESLNTKLMGQEKKLTNMSPFPNIPAKVTCC